MNEINTLYSSNENTTTEKISSISQIFNDTIRNKENLIQDLQIEVNNLKKKIENLAMNLETEKLEKQKLKETIEEIIDMQMKEDYTSHYLNNKSD